MSSSDQQIDAKTIEDTKQQIRGLVSEIAQLSKMELGPEEYYSAFLQRIVQALAAVGGAVWLLGEGRRPELAYQINISETLLDPASEDAKRHLRLLNYVVAKNEPLLAPPLSGAGDERAGGNPTRYLLVLAPLKSENSVEGIVEIFQRPDAQPNTQRGYLKFLLQMCDLAGEWLKNRKLKTLGDRHTLWEQADHFSRLVHDSLDLRETAYTVVNEGRRLIGCDRVSVAIARGNKCRIEAVSGQDTMEDRSNIMHLLGQLASRVVATGEPLWYDGMTDDLPPQVETALENYVDESYTKSLAVLPLRQPKQYYELTDQETARSEAEVEDHTTREIIGALIVEQIEHSVPRALIESRVDLVYEHTARALSNSMEHNNLFLMPLWRQIGKAKWMVKARTLPKTLLVVGAVLAGIVALCVVPWHFNIEGNGTLQPKVREDVFAQLNGYIVQVPDNIRHGAHVEKDKTILCVMEDTELKLKYQELLGEKNSRLEELRAVTDSLVRNAGKLSEAERVRLFGEQGQIEQRIRNIQNQLDLVEKKIGELTVYAPRDGVIITWDVEKLLQHRPVQIGQKLMTIADPEKAWEIEAYVREGRMGHVTRYVNENYNGDYTKLEAEYILAAAPGDKRVKGVLEVHETTDMHPDEGHSVLVRIGELTREELPIADPRPGQQATVDIRCGWAPIGYCWFHEAWEWVQKNVFF